MSQEQRYCPACGKPAPPAWGAVDSPRAGMMRHFRNLGFLWIIFSVIRLAPSFLLLGFERFFHFHMHMHRLPPFVPGLLHGIGWFLLVTAVAGIVTGWGLLERASWARPMAVALAVLALFDAPLGTALGIYTLWAMLSQGAAEEYDRG